MFEFSNIAEFCDDKTERAKYITLDLCHHIVGSWRQPEEEISDSRLVLDDGTVLDVEDVDFLGLMDDGWEEKDD